MPLKSHQHTIKTCKECSVPMPSDIRGKFCSGSCRKIFNNRRMTRGALIYDLAMIYRKDRKPGALGDLCHQISIYITADREDGRCSFNRYEGEPIPYNLLDTKRK